MRWFVDVSSVGKGAARQRYCVEADSWQRALQATRGLRDDPGPMTGFSIELHDDGFSAVDPVKRLKYAIKKTEDDAPLTTAEHPAESLTLERSSSSPPTSGPISESVPKSRSSRPPAPDLNLSPKPKSKGKGSKATLTPEPPRAAAKNAPANGKAAASTPPAAPLDVLAKREEDPGPGGPLTYREYAYFVDPPPSAEEATRLLHAQLDAVKTAIAGARLGKLVNLALFTVRFVGRPPCQPVATLMWKDWKGEPVVAFPDPNTPRVSNVPPTRMPASAAAAHAKGASVAPAPAAPASDAPPPPVAVPPSAAVQEPPSPPEPAAPVAGAPVVASEPPAAAPQVEPPIPTPASIPASAEPTRASAPPAASPSPQASPSVPTDVQAAAPAPPPTTPSAPPPEATPSASALDDGWSSETPLSTETTRMFVVPGEEGPAPAHAAAPEGTPSSTPPESLAPATTRGPNATASAPPAPKPRLRGDELIADLFESMHDLQFLQDAVEGADFCLTLALEKMPANGGIVHLYDIDRREFVITCAGGDGGDGLLLQRSSEQDAILGPTMRKRRPLVLPDATTSEPARTLPRYAALGGAKSLLVAPVAMGGRFLGAIELLNPTDGIPFTDDDGHALGYIAEQLASFVAERGILLERTRSTPPAAQAPAPARRRGARAR